MHADCDGVKFWIDSQSTQHHWHLNSGGPVVLGQSFWEKFSPCKNDPKMGLLSYFEKFCHSFLQQAYLNKIWYCLDFDMMGRDFRFITRFWISMTELFIIMNSFMITERKKNQWIYQWICDIQIIWKWSYIILLSIVAFNSCTDLYWFFPYDSQSSQVIQENFTLNFQRSHDQTSIYVEVVL